MAERGEETKHNMSDMAVVQSMFSRLGPAGDSVNEGDDRQLSDADRKARAVAGLRWLQELYVRQRGQVRYAVHQHTGFGDRVLPFEMQNPQDYFASRRPVATAAADAMEGTGCDGGDSGRGRKRDGAWLEFAFFDPRTMTPSNEHWILCRSGLVRYARYYALRKRAARHDATAPPKFRVHEVAVKVLDREQLAKQHEDVERERRAMQRVRKEGFSLPPRHLRKQAESDGTIQQRYFPQWRHFGDVHNAYVVTEYAANGSLNMYATKRISEYRAAILRKKMDDADLEFVESRSAVDAVTSALWRQEALYLFAGIVEAVAWMHARHVSHLDLDPRNIVVTAEGTILIVDMGSSEVMEEGDGRIIGRGRPILCKPHFRAPEVHAHNRSATKESGVDGAAADVWSLGVVLYYLLCLSSGGEQTKHPFATDLRWLQNLRNRSRMGLRPSLEPGLYDLLNGMLQDNPKVRISAQLASASPALTEARDSFEHDLATRVGRELQKYDAEASVRVRTRRAEEYWGEPIGSPQFRIAHS